MVNCAGLAFGIFALLLTCSCSASDTNNSFLAESLEKGTVDRVLIDLHDQFTKGKEADQEQIQSRNPQLRIVNGTVLIDAVASADVARLENDLLVLGATNLSSYGRIVSCFIPIENIDQLMELESLQFARPVLAGTLQLKN